MERAEQWQISYAYTIHKNGKKDDCDNYRGIAVLSSISRVYGTVLHRKTELEYSTMKAEEP